MPIKCNSDHSSQTLEDIYIKLSRTSTNAYADVGKKMLQIVQLINQLFKETVIWGLTSHARLVLQNEDNWQAPWFVIISSIGKSEYYFEYLLPKHKQPWDGAYVRGQANSFEEVKKYLVIAMTESEAWEESSELKSLAEIYRVGHS